MPYKRQTKDVYYKGRQALDPSKQLYKEDKLKTQNEKSFINNAAIQGKQYEQALDTWDKGEAKKYQERIDFWDQVSPAMSKFFSEDLVKGLELRKNIQSDYGLRKWNELDDEKKLLYTHQNNQILARQHEINQEKIRYSDIADQLGFTEYGNFLRGISKNGRTAVFLELAKETTATLPGDLKTAFDGQLKNQDGSEMSWVDSEGTKFFAKDIDKVPALRADRINRIMSSVLQENRLRAGITGLNNDLINSQIGDDIDAAKAAQLKILDKNSRVRTAIENTNETKLQIKNLFTTNLEKNSTDTSYVFKAGPNGETNPLVKVLENAYDSFFRDGLSQEKASPDQYAVEQLAGVLNDIYQNSKEQGVMEDFIKDVIGYNGARIDGVTILMEHRDGSGKKVSLADINSKYFGAEQAWNTSTNNLGSGQSGNNWANGVVPNNVAAEWLDKMDKSGLVFKATEAEINGTGSGRSRIKGIGPLYDDETGELNSAHAHTWIYKLLKTNEPDWKGKKFDAKEYIQKLQAIGVYDMELFREILDTQVPHSPAKTRELLSGNKILNFVRENGDNKEIKLSDLEGYSRTEVLKILKEDHPNVKIVENYYGEKAEKEVKASDTRVRNEVTANGHEGKNTEIIIADLKNKIQSAVSKDETGLDEGTAIEYYTGVVLTDFQKQRYIPESKYYQKEGADDSKDVLVTGDRIAGKNYFTEEVLDRNEFLLTTKIAKEAKNSNVEENLFSQVLLFNKHDWRAIQIGTANASDLNFPTANIPIYLRKATLRDGQWPDTAINSQIRLWNEKVSAKNPELVKPLIPETEFMKGLKQNWTPQAYLEYLELAEASSLTNGKLINNREILRKLNNDLNRISGKHGRPPVTNINAAVTALRNAENNSVIETDDPANSLIGAYSLRESEVKKYYEDNNINGGEYNRSHYLKNSNDVQTKIATALVSSLSSEIYETGVTDKKYEGYWNSKYRKKAPWLIRQLEYRLREGSLYDGTGFYQIDNKTLLMRSNNFSSKYLEAFHGGGS